MEVRNTLAMIGPVIRIHAATASKGLSAGVSRDTRQAEFGVLNIWVNKASGFPNESHLREH